MARLQVTQVPTAVAEIAAGIILGQSGLNWVRNSSQLTFLSNLGVMLLLFLSGMEIDFSLFGKKHQHRRGPHGQVNRFKQPYAWFVKVTKATTQLDIRLAFFLLFALVAVAEGVGAEDILGAFLAGRVMKLLGPTASTREKLTVLMAQQLTKDHYVTQVAALNQEDYETYDSEVPAIQLVNHLPGPGDDLFDCDIFVAGSTSDQTNFAAALQAKKLALTA